MKPPALFIAPHTQQLTRAELLGRAYQIGYRVTQGTAVLGVLLALLIGALIRRRSLQIKTGKAVLLAVGKRPLGVLPFAALLSGAGTLLLVLFWTVTVRLAISRGEADRSTIEGTPPAIGGELEANESATALRDELRSLRIVFDGSGVTVNGKLVAPAQSVSSDKLQQIEPVATALHEFYVRREAFDMLSLPATLVTISPEVSAAGAASVIFTIASASPGGAMHASVGETQLELRYIPSWPPIPKESFLYLAPRSPLGYSLERQQVVRDLRSHGPSCRDRSKPQPLLSERDVAAAAARLCAGTVDCIDHVELSLSAGRTFGNVAPWLAAALHVLRFPDVRFVDEGADPVPDAIVCVDGG